MTLLEEFLTTGVFAFLIIFVRFGTAMMIMPGIGDSLVPANIRLYIALGLSLVVAPLIRPYIPVPLPAFAIMASLIVMEFVTGLFIGTIARILMMALDTAGMLVSLASGVSNAQVFNPSLAVQGSVFGAFFSMAGVTLLFVTNMHHLLIYGLVESYELFPIGGVPEAGSMAELMARAVSASFLTAVQITVPFIVVSLLLYIGMGVLSRLMPQVQVFILALPVQILLAFVTLAIVFPSMMLFFLTRFEDGMVYFLSTSGG
jgi:flagellar biosynthetic protein FliR